MAFGVVPVRAGRVVVGEALGRLVRPAVAPSPRSQVVHGLRPGDLAGAPPMAEVQGELRDALAGRYLLAWCADVELAFLGQVFGAAWRWRRRTLDVQRLAVALDRAEGEVGPRGRYALQAAARRSGVPVASPHDALDDALVTAQLFIVLAPRLARHGHGTVGRLLRLAARTRVPAPTPHRGT